MIKKYKDIYTSRVTCGQLEYTCHIEVLVSYTKNKFIGKIVSRAFDIHRSPKPCPKGITCIQGSLTQIKNFFKKLDYDYELWNLDQYAIDDIIRRTKQNIFATKKEAFIKDLKTILKKHDLTMSLQCEGRSGYDGYSYSDVILTDTATDLTSSFLSVDDFEGEDIFDSEN